MEFLTMKLWSPYLVGIGIGILSWFTFLLSNKPIGCSTAFARTSGMMERWFIGNKVDEKLYFKEFPAKIDWEWMLVLGIFIGSFLSAKFSGEFKVQWIPSVWLATFGSNITPRVLTAFLGGIILGLGARWAGGCTSGHGISGALQLTVSSWIAAVCFFISGIATAYFIYYRIGG